MIMYKIIAVDHVQKKMVIDLLITVHILYLLCSKRIINHRITY